MWISSLLCILLAVLASFLPASAARAGAAKLPMFGIQFHGTWAGYTDEAKDNVLTRVKAAGVSSVRIDVSWAMLEPSGSGVLSDWGVAQVDSAIRMAYDRGLRPLVTLWLAPTWANGSDDERVAPTSPAGLAGLSSISERLAAKYKGVVDSWEVWNEPNSPDFMRGADPTVYANVLRAAYAGFKAGDASSTVVFGGPSYVDDAWVDKVLSAGGAGNYDVMGVHPYMAVADESPSEPDNGTIWRMNHLPALTEVMAKHGEGAKEIWFTEFGWTVNPTTATTANWQRGVSALKQSTYLNATIDQVMARYPQVKRLYWYQDRADSDSPENAGFGMIYPDGAGTPALQTVARRYAPDVDPALIGKPLPPADATAAKERHRANPFAKPAHLPLPERSSLFVSMAPVRVADTRAGQPDVAFPAVKAPVGAGEVLRIPVAGTAGVPRDAKAVSLNVAATGSPVPGHLRVFPCGEAVPNASTLNFPAGRSVANAALTQVGDGGAICVYASVQTDVFVDINGYTPWGTEMVSTPPVRVADTRVGQEVVAFPAVKQSLGAEQEIAVPVTGAGGVPADAEAVSLNVTAAGPSAPGHLRVYPCGAQRPNASTLNYPAGQTVANAALTRIGTDGAVCIYSAARTDVFVDVSGYVPAAVGYTPMAPVRVADTRVGEESVAFPAAKQPLRAMQTLTVPVAGLAGVPFDAAAVALNVTAVGPSAPGHLRVYPCGTELPNASTLNYPTGQNVANASLTRVGAGGAVCVYTVADTDVLVDVNGWFAH
ncbi:MAG: cellulase family glycosylhydrolase [Candidatus Nanopelagicales bacterium]